MAMIKSISQVGADIPDKNRYMLNKSDILVVIQDEKDITNPLIEAVRNNYNHKAIYFRVRTTQVITPEAAVDLNISQVLSQFAVDRKDLVICCVGTHQDALQCNEESQYRLVDNIMRLVISAVGVERIGYVLSGAEHGPELMSARSGLSAGCHVRVVACNKFKVRRYGSIYESSAEKITAYIQGN